MKIAQGIRPCGAFLFCWSNLRKNFSFGAPVP